MHCRSWCCWSDRYIGSEVGNPGTGARLWPVYDIALRNLPFGNQPKVPHFAMPPNPGRSTGRATILKSAAPGVPAPAGLKDRVWDLPAISGWVAEFQLTQVTDLPVFGVE